MYHLLEREKFFQESNPKMIYSRGMLPVGNKFYDALFFFYHGWLAGLQLYRDARNNPISETVILANMQKKYPNVTFNRDIAAQKYIQYIRSQARKTKKSKIFLKTSPTLTTKTWQPWIFAVGTEFQIEIWRELLKIPVGETRTYQDIAKQIGKPKHMRAIGGANNANPVVYFIPCHRVINHKGNIGGYAYGINCKRDFLSAEGVAISA